MQEWLKKIVETEEKERKKSIPRQPFCISKSTTCPICHKSFEKREIGDPILAEKYSAFSYQEWRLKLGETTDYCPLCGKTFDFIYKCLICGKTIKTNKEKYDNGGIIRSVCGDPECQKAFRFEYKMRRCLLCNHPYIISLSEDYTHEQIFEGNSVDYWKEKIEKADVYCPLSGSIYFAIRHCDSCKNVFRTFNKNQILCGSSRCKATRKKKLKREKKQVKKEE